MGHTCMLKDFKSRKAETLLEVTIALFVIGVGLNVTNVVSHRMLNLTAQNHDRLTAEFLAREALDGVMNMRDTSYIRYADPGCWKTIETADVCVSTGPNASQVMDEPGGGPIFYSTFFDRLDFTWSLENPKTLSDSNSFFDDDMILLRLPNIYSIHEKFLGDSETKPVYTGQEIGADNTYFYRRVKVESTDANSDGDEDLIVTSQVKWPYKSQVFSYSIAKTLLDAR